MEENLHQSVSESEIRAEFKTLTGELDKWGEFVDNVLNKYVESCFPSPEHLQKKAIHRVKNEDSYCEKVLLRYSYKHPLKEVTDKVGTRIVLLNRSDVKTVSDFVRECNKWTLQKQTRDTESSILNHPDVFSYQSDHFIVHPNLSYKTEVDKQLLTCEIQIRTILQHAYAEISHDTVYKKTMTSNNKALRMLASSMAFIEAADEKFIQIYDEMENKQDFDVCLQNRLIELYKLYINQYDEETYNVVIASNMLKIYTTNDRQQIFNEIKEFVKNEDDNIRFILQTYREKYVLFRHPVVLVALYGIRMLQHTTYSYWPFSNESLRVVAQSMQISYSSLQ